MPFMHSGRSTQLIFTSPRYVVKLFGHNCTGNIGYLEVADYLWSFGQTIVNAFLLYEFSGLKRASHLGACLIFALLFHFAGVMEVET